MALVLDCGSPAGHRLRLGGPGLALGTVPSGRRPALIGTRWRRPAGRIDLARCSSRGAGPALGALPAFPGVGTPRGNGFSCGCGKALPPSTWRRPKSRGLRWQWGEGSGGWRPTASQCHTLERRPGDRDRGDSRYGRLWGVVSPYCLSIPSVWHIGLGPLPTLTHGDTAALQS